MSLSLGLEDEHCNSNKSEDEDAEDHVVPGDNGPRSSRSETSNDIEIDRPVDKNEAEVIKKFMAEGCGCRMGPQNTPCSQLFGKSTLENQRNMCHELSDNELDLFILGSIQAHRRCKQYEEVYKTMSKDRDRGKKSSNAEYHFRSSTKYFYADMQICIKTFCFLHTIGDGRLKRLRGHFDENGVVPRTHGNTGRKTTGRVITAAETSDVVNFLNKLADNVAIPLPGRLPNHRDYRVMKLPSDMTRQSIHSDYSAICSQASKTPVCRTAFCNLWDEHLPYLTVMTPASDLCSTCHDNNTAIQRASCLPEDVKAERYQAALEHLRLAGVQRDYYNKQCQNSKDDWVHFQNGDSEELQSTHLSFDFAQNVQYPHSSQQLGPAYFKTARKCGIFGVHCDGSGIQTNYLIDECENVGKGANCVISLVHHYLEHHSYGARKVYLHCDNCCGQNKNNALLQYCCWRVAAELNNVIEISFLLVGHTKFSPDRSFGTIKRTYNRTVVDTLDDIESAVKKSSKAGLNDAILTYDYVRDKRNVNWYDFTSFLSRHMNPVPGLLTYHHFHFSSTHKGSVLLRKFADQEATSVQVMKNSSAIHYLSSDDLSNFQINPSGLSITRQWYLHEQISQFCSSSIAASLTCPRPITEPPNKKKCV